jgi:hypothetical protein
MREYKGEKEGKPMSDAVSVDLSTFWSVYLCESLSDTKLDCFHAKRNKNSSFSRDSHPSLSVTPATGRLDRRSGAPTIMQIVCEPNGQGGTFQGNLVINLPEDNSKICYKVTINSM